VARRVSIGAERRVSGWGDAARHVSTGQRLYDCVVLAGRSRAKAESLIYQCLFFIPNLDKRSFYPYKNFFYENRTFSKKITIFVVEFLWFIVYNNYGKVFRPKS